MEEILLSASDLRKRCAAVLGAVSNAPRRVIVHRHGKVVGAVIGPQELKRLQHLEPPPPPLSDFERKQKARETLARHRAMSQPLSRAYEAVALARAGTDPLALATAEFELEELQAQSEALSREWMDLEAPR